MLSKQVPLGIYEKALPAGECWLERLKLAKQLGFDFVEMSWMRPMNVFLASTGARSSVLALVECGRRNGRARAVHVS